MSEFLKLCEASYDSDPSFVLTLAAITLLVSLYLKYEDSRSRLHFRRKKLERELYFLTCKKWPNSISQENLPHENKSGKSILLLGVAAIFFLVFIVSC